MKSDSDSAPRAKWRLKKTLARKLDFRPLEKDDIRYLWAAYKSGSLKSMGGVFAEDGMDAEEFKTAFEDEITARYHGAWTMFAESKKGYMPVGVILGFYSHPDPAFSPFMIVGDMLWFPWASPRNKIESAVNFFHRIRKDIAMVEYAREDVKDFFVAIASHGVMRRVGTMHNVYPGEPTAIFETRAP